MLEKSASLLPKTIQDGQLVLVYSYIKQQYYIWCWSTRSKYKADIGEVRVLCVLPDSLKKDQVIKIEVVE